LAGWLSGLEVGYVQEVGGAEKAGAFLGALPNFISIGIGLGSEQLYEPEPDFESTLRK